MGKHRVYGRSSKSVHQLKVTLRDVRPPVWRRIQVPSDFTFGDLHCVLQAAMGWEDDHLHAFMVGGERYADDEVEDPWGGRPKHEHDVSLDELAPLGARLRYEYDFGDGWEHDIAVEKILPGDPAVTYPRCLAGRRACPPEDCGGPSSYAQLVEAIASPRGAEDEGLLEWVGDDFDPEAFNVANVNASFAPLKDDTPRHGDHLRIAIGGRWLDDVRIRLLTRMDMANTVSYLSYPAQRHRASAEPDHLVVSTQAATLVQLFAEGVLVPIGGPAVTVQNGGQELGPCVLEAVAADETSPSGTTITLRFRRADAP